MFCFENIQNINIPPQHGFKLYDKNLRVKIYDIYIYNKYICIYIYIYIYIRML